MQTNHKFSILAVAAAGVLAISSLAPVMADNVQYSTSGLFTAGTGATAIANGLSFTSGGTTLQLIFTPQSGNVNTPVVGDLGTFQVNIAGSGSVSIPTSPSSSKFKLTINQTVPSPGSGSLTSTLAGTVSYNSGYVQVQWDTPTNVTIGATNYALVNLTNGLPGIPNNTTLLDPTATSGSTKVSALITTSAPVPEPATMVLAGVGLTGLLGLRRRS